MIGENPFVQDKFCYTKWNFCILGSITIWKINNDRLLIQVMSLMKDS